MPAHSDKEGFHQRNHDERFDQPTETRVQDGYIPAAQTDKFVNRPHDFTHANPDGADRPSVDIKPTRRTYHNQTHTVTTPEPAHNNRGQSHGKQFLSTSINEGGRSSTVTDETDVESACSCPSREHWCPERVTRKGPSSAQTESHFCFLCAKTVVRTCDEVSRDPADV